MREIDKPLIGALFYLGDSKVAHYKFDFQSADCRSSYYLFLILLKAWK